MQSCEILVDCIFYLIDYFIQHLTMKLCLILKLGKFKDILKYICLSFNCIYVLSVYPILTFIIPPIYVISGVVYGVNKFIYVHSFLNKICIAQHQYIPANLKSNILPYHLVCYASNIELNFCNYLPLTVLQIFQEYNVYMERYIYCYPITCRFSHQAQ